MTTETEKGSHPETASRFDEMVRAGVHVGHKTSKTYPKMKPYITGMRNAVHVIDLAKTNEKLAEALVFVKKLAEEGKTLLLVGTKVQLRTLVKNTAAECGLPFVTERWIGGTLTNFDTIGKRIAYLNDLTAQEESGELAKFTKKEQLNLTRLKDELEVKVGGMKRVTKLPDAIFICDLDVNALAAREAKKKGIPVIAICDTNIDPSLATYPIPANDDALSSVTYVLGKIREALRGAGTKTEETIQQ